MSRVLKPGCFPERVDGWDQFGELFWSITPQPLRMRLLGFCRARASACCKIPGRCVHTSFISRIARFAGANEVHLPTRSASIIPRRDLAAERASAVKGGRSNTLNRENRDREKPVQTFQAMAKRLITLNRDWSR